MSHSLLSVPGRALRPLAIAVLLHLAAVAAPLGAQDDGGIAGPLVERASRAYQQHRWDDAIDAAREATEIAPELPKAWQILGYAHRERGHRGRQDKERALEALGRYYVLSQDDQAQKVIEHLYFEGEPPRWIAPAAIPAMPIEPRLDKVRVARNGGALTAVDVDICITAARIFPEKPPMVHPVYGRNFHRVAFGYALDPTDPEGRLYERVRLYYPSEASAKRPGGYLQAGIVPRISSVVLRLLCYRSAYLGADDLTGIDEPLSVWLVEGEEPGAHQRGKDVALFGVNLDRSPLEWLRMICHEFGHYAIPALGMFDEPEAWANGLAGEHLFMAWLWANHDDGLIPWGEELVDPTGFLNTRCGPVVQGFFAQQPDGTPVYGADIASVNHLLGLVLYTDLVLGHGGLGEVFGGLPGSANLEALMQRTKRAFEAAGGSLQLPARMFSQPESQLAGGVDFTSYSRGDLRVPGGRQVVYWVYLGRGSWTMTLEAQPRGEDESPLKVIASLEGRSPVLAQGELPAGASLAVLELGPKAPGWYRVSLAHEDREGALLLRSLGFVRSEEAP